MDEHRIGLKPIVRGVWAPVGERPIALGHHRFEWLYVTGFVEPATGRTVELRGINMFRVWDGRVIEQWAQLDMLGLLQQIGVLRT